jgi:hypothetical protein
MKAVFLPQDIAICPSPLLLTEKGNVFKASVTMPASGKQPPGLQS